MADTTKTVVTCQHCRSRLKVDVKPTTKRFRCPDCREYTPIAVGVALDKNLAAEERDTADRWLPVKLLVAVVGLLLLAGGIYLQTGATP